MPTDLTTTFVGLLNRGGKVGLMDGGDGTWRLAGEGDTPDREATLGDLLAVRFTFTSDDDDNTYRFPVGPAA